MGLLLGYQRRGWDGSPVCSVHQTWSCACLAANLRDFGTGWHAPFPRESSAFGSDQTEPVPNGWKSALIKQLISDGTDGRRRRLRTDDEGTGKALGPDEARRRLNGRQTSKQNSPAFQAVDESTAVFDGAVQFACHEAGVLQRVTGHGPWAERGPRHQNDSLEQS